MYYNLTIYYSFSMVFAVIIILYGFILLTRKKFMVRRTYDRLFILYLAILNPTISLIEMGYGLQLFISISLVTVLMIIIGRGRYIITNVNAQMVSSILVDILKERNLSYDEKKNTVILKNYDNKRIIYIQTLNSVEVNLKNVRNLPIYEEIKTKLKSRIKEVNVTVFPFLGLFYIGLGGIVIVALQIIINYS